MKKIITFIKIIALFVFLVGCGENNATVVTPVGSDLTEISNLIPNLDLNSTTEDDNYTIKTDLDYDKDIDDNETIDFSEVESDLTETADYAPNYDSSSTDDDLEIESEFDYGEYIDDNETTDYMGIDEDWTEAFDYMPNYDSSSNNENCNYAMDSNSPYSSGYFHIGRFRPIFYNLPYAFVNLVGRDAYFAWMDTRSLEEMQNENMAVGFIKYFNISKEDFTRANEERRQFLESIEASPERSSHFELYPVDLIFTFDNERINEYFLWENTPVAQEFGMGMELEVHRPLFYNMPAPFVNLVGRETFIEWRRSRSQEERENENIAISFVRDFNISREDFNKANEYMRQVWANFGFASEEFRIRAEVEHGWTKDPSSQFEVYDVDMIFGAVESGDIAQVSEFFLWENSPIEHERHLGDVARAQRAAANR